MSATDLIEALESAAAGGDPEAARVLRVIAERLSLKAIGAGQRQRQRVSRSRSRAERSGRAASRV